MSCRGSDVDGDQEVRSFQRSVILVAITSVALLCSGVVVEWVFAGVQARETARVVSWCLAIVLAIATWFAHFVWQMPHCSSRLLATATTLASWLLGLVLIVTLGTALHSLLVGGMSP